MLNKGLIFSYKLVMTKRYCRYPWAGYHQWPFWKRGFLRCISSLSPNLFLISPTSYLPIFCLSSIPILPWTRNLKTKAQFRRKLVLFSLWCQIFGRDIQFYSIKTLFSCLKMFQGQFFSLLGNKNIRRVWSALNKYFVLFLSSNIVSILSGTIKRWDKL